MKIKHNILWLWVALWIPSVVVFAATEKRPATMTVQTGPDSIRITAYDNRIRIQNAPSGSTLEIYSVVGIKVKEIKLKECDGEYPVNIPRGYYIARIRETVRKIVIR
ncbi:MAG TPA: hypothetical protein DDZ04_01110 [Parabacteroides sp.]|nr:hypothetical protein [Parabacteroides sp.]